MMVLLRHSSLPWLTDSFLLDRTFQNVVVTNDEHSAFRTSALVLASWCPRIKHVLLESPDDEPTVILSGTPFQRLNSLEQFLRSGQVSIQRPDEVDELKADFEALGLSLPDDFWTSSVPEDPAASSSVVRTRIKLESSSDVKWKDSRVTQDARVSQNSLVNQDTPRVCDDTRDNWDDQPLAMEIPVKCEIFEDLPPPVNGTPKRNRKRSDARRDSDPDSAGTCAVCAQHINFRFMLEHRRWHEIKETESGGGFACLICDKVFDVLIRFREHKLVHKDEKWQCPDCKSVYGANESRRIDRHLILHKNEKERPFLCDICAKGFKEVGDLNDHKARVHDNVVQTCDVCGKSCRNAKMLERHKNRNHKYSLQCPYCGKAYSNNDKLNLHINVNHLEDSEKPFQCELCGKGFGTKQRLREHKDIHENLRNHVCTFCEYRCNNRANLKKHVRQVHKMDES